MAGVSDCFTVGSTVSCTTCFNQHIEGEVMAFDHQSKMLILKSAPSSASKLNDVIVVNLSLCSDVQVTNEAEKVPDAQPPSLNINRLNTRVRNAVEQKRRWVSAITAGVSPEGQKLYMNISKTINQVTWRGPNIVVFNDVVIKPPYKLEDVNGSPESRELTYVKKLVEKFINDQSSTSAEVAA